VHEEAERVAPLLLGAIHGQVGIFDERLQGVAVVGRQGDADAGGDEDFVAAQVEGRLGNIYLFAYLGKPQINVATAGIIGLGAAGTAVDAEANETNVCIGKYYLKVKSGAAVGTSQITLLDTATADGGESFGETMVVTPVTFNVESSVDLVMAPVVNTLGAQIRTTGIQGLRFGTKLTKNDFFKGIGLTGVNKTGGVITDIQFGTLILPTAYLSEQELVIGGTYSKTVANVIGTNIYEETPTYIVFTAVLTGIPEAQYDTSFTARAYVKFKVDGVDQVVYFDPIERTVNGVKDSSSMQ
jgi:hypothetical protein